MSLEKLHPLIWVVHDFIDPETTDSVLKEAAMLPPESWNLDAPYLNEESFWLNRTTPPDSFSDGTRDLMEALCFKVIDYFADYKEIIEIGNLHRTIADGRSLDYHVDNYDGADADNMFGIVLYLNDNYIGGELHYKDLGISYKPKAGDLVVHYAGLLHGVKEVTEGTRYIFTMFVRGNLETTFMGEVADPSLAL